MSLTTTKVCNRFMRAIERGQSAATYNAHCDEQGNVWLHKTQIREVDPDTGDVWWNTGGYDTPTTRRWLHGLGMPASFTHNNTWIISVSRHAVEQAGLMPGASQDVNFLTTLELLAPLNAGAAQTRRAYTALWTGRKHMVLNIAAHYERATPPRTRAHAYTYTPAAVKHPVLYVGPNRCGVPLALLNGRVPARNMDAYVLDTVKTQLSRLIIHEQ